MTAFTISPPYKVFNNVDGSPLENGYVYVGTVNLNPETDPIAMYADAAMTQPIAQPMRTSGGAIVRNGTPTAVYTNSPYSMTVRDMNGNLVYTFPDSTAIDNTANLLISLGNSSDAALGDALVAMKQPITGATARTVHTKLMEFISVKDFGAVGDGSADDSTAFNAAVTYASANRVGIHFPAGTYKLLTPSALSGRCFLRANGDATILGEVVYSDAAFPTSAGTATPLTDTAPFFYASGISFKSTSTTLYALSVTAQVSTQFLDCAEISNCKFYGYNGFHGTNLISVNITNCWFYSWYIGIFAEGCTNWQYNSCRFRNQVKYGVVARSTTARLGGENHKFVNCEFAVCATGAFLVQSSWASFENCLFDYCVLPLYLAGSDFCKLTNCYLGAGTDATITGAVGYVAPPTNGIALFAEQFVDAALASFSAGVTAVNCEFVSYVPGTNQPIVYLNGFNALYPAVIGINRASFSHCKFLISSAHSMLYMLSITTAQLVALTDNEFISYDLSTTLLTPYYLASVNEFFATGSQNYNCTQLGTRVAPTDEKLVAQQLQAYPNSTIAFQDAGGTTRLSIPTSGMITLQNATVSGSATVGAATALPAAPLGYLTLSINGGNTKIPYYNV